MEKNDVTEAVQKESRAAAPLLLVTTHNYVALVDSATRRLRRVFNLPGLDCLYGITQDARGYILVAQTLAGRILRFDRRLQQVGLHLQIHGKPAPGIHQILWWEGRLYVAVTKRDRIEVFEGERRVLGRDLSGRPTEDVRHPNSVNVLGDKLAVLSHNKSVILSAVHLLDFELKPRGKVSMGWDAHNVWLRDGAIHVLSSKTNRILRSEKGGGVHCVRQLEEGTWARGLAESATTTFVGISKGAGRDHRHDPVDAQIQVYDRNWKRLDEIRLPGAGQVHEIRLIGEPDAGHAGRTMNVDASV